MKQIREMWVRMPDRKAYDAELDWHFTIRHMSFRFAYDHEGD